MAATNYNKLKKDELINLLKKTQRQLKKTQTLADTYRLIADNSPDLLWAKNMNNEFIFVNKAMCENLLNAKDSREPIGKDDLFFAEREMKSHIENPEWHTFGDVCRNTDNIIKEVRSPRRFDESGYIKGKFVIFDVNKAPLLDKLGNMIGTVGSARTVTKDRLTEIENMNIRKDLEQSREYFRYLVENSNDILALVDSSGNIIYESPSIQKVLGYKPEEIIGKKAYKFLHPGDAEENSFFYNEILSNPGFPINIRFRFLAKDNTYRCMEGTAVNLLNEQYIKGILLNFRDVTEKRKNLEAIKEKEERLKFILSTIPDIVCIIDREGYIYDFYASSLGLSQEQMNSFNGKNISEFFPPDKVKTNLAVIRNTLDTQQLQHIEFEYPFNNSILSYESRMIPHRDDKVTIITRDVTYLKNAEKLKDAAYNISEAALKSKDLNELYKEIHRITASLMHANNFYIATYDENTDHIDFPYFIDEIDDWIDKKPYGNGLTEYVLKTGKPLLADPEKFNELVASGEVELVGSDSLDWLGVPLKAYDTTFGVLVVQSYSPGTRYTEENVKSLEIIANQAAFAIIRKRTEEALSTSESRLRQIIDLVPHFIFAKDEEGTFTLANQAVADAYGTNRENLIGKKDKDFTPSPDEVTHFISDDLEVITAGKSKVIPYEEITDAHGNIRILQTTKIPFTFSGTSKRSVLGVSVDITDRIRAEEAMRKSEEKYRLLANNMGDLLLTLDMDFNVKYMSPSIKSYTGFEPDELLNLHFTKLLAESSVSAASSAILEEISKTDNGYSDIPLPNRVVELEIFKKDGTTTWVEIKSSFIRDNKNKLVGIVCVGRDISLRKEAEKTLRDAKEKAERSEKIKTEFLAQMSHEIRSPINVILSFVGLLREELQNKMEKELFSSFDSIDNAGKRIIRTIDLLLNMSEIQTGSMDIRKKPLNLLNDIVLKVLPEFAYVAKRKGLNLMVNFSESENFEIIADEYSTTQIFNNLIDNAIKYTPNGKIIINLSKHGKNKIKADIEDTGIGISEEFISKIFEPFTQEEQGYTRKYEGSGLGMALVKNYCSLNGAELNVESQKGLGTTFSIIFNGNEN